LALRCFEKKYIVPYFASCRWLYTMLCLSTSSQKMITFIHKNYSVSNVSPSFKSSQALRMVTSYTDLRPDLRFFSNLQTQRVFPSVSYRKTTRFRPFLCFFPCFPQALQTQQGVEVAVPDTWVQLDDLPKPPRGPTPQSTEMCDANPRCKARRARGTGHGEFWACCLACWVFYWGGYWI
jgi:hypothetical protein